MPAATTLAIIGGIGAAASLASTTYSIVNSENQRVDAEKKNKEQAGKQAALENEAKTQQANAEASADAQSKALSERSAALQREKGAGGSGRQGTILTGLSGGDSSLSSGLPNANTSSSSATLGGGKTLLGG
jgi:membrane protein involved in colicin uptake